MRPVLVIVAVFLIVRVVAAALGVQFDFDNLGTWWQIADPVLLQTRLLATLYALHSQPPLFNLLIGLVLKAGPASFGPIMGVVFGAITLGGIIGLFWLGRAVLGSERVALSLALWFCISPDVLLFSEKLFYDSLVPWLLCLGFWGIHLGLARERTVPLLLGFTTLAVVVLMRSMFHPLWFLAIVGLTYGLAGFRGRVLACAALPGAAIGAVLVKNLVVFGFLGLSSWAPLNLVGVTVEKMPDSERAQLLAAGVLSPLSRIDAFSSIEALLPLLPPIPPTGEPVLDAPRKSNGQPNMNHMAMLVASRLRLADGLAALRADPLQYVAVLITSVYHFHRPANEFRDVGRELVHIESWTRLVNATIGLQPAAWFGSSLDPARPQGWALQLSYGSVLISLGFAIATVQAVAHMLRALRRRERLPPALVVLVLMLFTGTFVFVVSSALDVLENNRARYTVAPLLTLGAAWVVLGWVRRARGAPTPGSSTRPG